MGNVDYKALREKERQRENEILRLCPHAKHQSGIYMFFRESEQGFKFAYIGQATRSVLGRMAQHLNGYETRIDLSIRKYGLWHETDNPYGFKAGVVCYCEKDECDEKEQLYIKACADKGYQLLNVTTGSQGKGKTALTVNRPPKKTYRQGIEQGRKETQEFIAKLFEKNLVYGINGTPNATKEKALAKFEEFLKGENNVSR
jgi:hypothetical protein